MYRILLLTMMGLLILTSPARAGKIRVATSILPVQYFVDQIGGDMVESLAMVQPGADPHTFEPKPSQMNTLSSADLFFAIGLGFEETWLPRFKSANRTLKVINVDAGITKIPMATDLHDEHEAENHDEKDEAGHTEDHHGDHDGLDPHIWTAPPLVKQIAATILAALIEADPDHTTQYTANHAVFIQQVDTVHADLQTVLKNADTEFMVYHPSWGYFAQAYHLKQISIEMEGKSPGPRQLAETIKYARKHAIKVLFVQPQFSDKSAQIIAREINGQVVKADPLAYDWADNLRRIATAFKNAM